MKKNKVFILILFLMLIVAISIFGYIYIATDIFKSGKELFGKYFSQELEIFNKMTDLKTTEIYKNLKNENKLDVTTDIQTVYSEGGEISNPFNNLSVKLNLQKDNDKNYFFANGKIILKEENTEEPYEVQDNVYLQTEIIKQDNQYGIRFADAVKQFVTVKSDEKLPSIANEIGIDANILSTIINVIDGNENIISGQETNDIKNKYFEIIKTELYNGEFSKQRNAIITYNNQTTKTNAYAVSLTSEQVTNILVQILNDLKTESSILDKISSIGIEDDFINEIDNKIKEITENIEIPAVKIVVYEQNKSTIRTIIEIGQNKIIIENENQNNELKTRINYVELNNEQTEEIKVEISKIIQDNEEKIDISIVIYNENDENKILISNSISENSNEIKHMLEIKNDIDIITKSIIVENNIQTNTEFEQLETLKQGNYVPLSDMSDENKRHELIELLKQIVPQKINEKLEVLINKLKVENNETTSDEDTKENVPEMSQTDINKFNSQFEFYIGNEVSAENVRTLLEIVQNHLKSYEIQEKVEEENVENKKINIKIKIEKDVENKESINKINEVIQNKCKYKVVISYNETNGIIDYITIIEI